MPAYRFTDPSRPEGDRTVYVAPENVSEALQKGWEPAPGQRIFISGAGGSNYSVPVEQLHKELNEGSQPESTPSMDYRQHQADLEAEYGSGFFNRVKAFGEGAFSGISFGLLDPLMDDEATRARAQFMPGTRLLGSLSGAIAPALLTGGVGGAASVGRAGGAVKAGWAASRPASALGRALQFTPAGGTARIGRFVEGAVGAKLGVGAAVEGASLLGRAARAVGPMAAGAAAEGAIVDAAYGVSDVMLSDDDLSVEALVGATGTGLARGALFGGVLGGGIAAVTHGGAALIGKAGRLAGKVGTKAAAKVDDAAAQAASKVDDLDNVDGQTFRQDIGNRWGYAHDDNERLLGDLDLTLSGDEMFDFGPQAAGVHVPEGVPAMMTNAMKTDLGRLGYSADEISRMTPKEAHGVLRLESNLSGKATANIPDSAPTFTAEQASEVREGMKRLSKAQKEFPFKISRTLKGGLDTGAGELDSVTTINQSEVVKLFSSEDNFLATLKKTSEFEDASEHLRDTLNKFGYSTEKLQFPDRAALHETWFKIRDSQKIVDAHKFSRMDAVLGLYAVTSPEFVDKVLEQVPVIGPVAADLIKLYALVRGYKVLRGAPEGALSAVTNVLGPQRGVGGLGVLGGPVSVASKASRLVGGKLEGVADLASRFVRGTGKVGRRAAPATAAAILSNKDFFFGDDEIEPQVAVTKSTPLGKLYQKRAEQLTRALNSPEALKARMDASLARLAEINPVLAQKVGAVAIRGLEYLLETMPKNPGIGSMFDSRNSRYTPPDAEVAKWARIVATVNDPDFILESMSNGTLTKAQVDAVRAVYPTYFARIQTLLLEKAGEMGDDLSYDQRLQLSQLYDVEIDSVMRPGFITSMQSNFVPEEPSQTNPSPPSPTAMARISKGERLDTKTYLNR